MRIFPAIDIKDGKCVMLSQGDKDRKTIYGDDPIEMAIKWESMGAKALHIVDLDGAFYGNSVNTHIIKGIIDAISIPIQIGGGIRTIEKIESFMEYTAVERVILGTTAVRNPKLLQKALNRYGNRIAVGVDARDGLMAIRGWVEVTDLDSIEFVKYLKGMGVKTIVYTDITRDGMLSGSNISKTKDMISETGLNVIASGGVSTMDDLIKLKEIRAMGAIIGQALYKGNIELKDALKLEGDI